ncbi:pyruvate kinase [Peptoniphilus indolicus]|uniref:Pyruvate kinase n=2 Tax=Peptoniphilus indolicus TaxID=33030 RepID=G4D2L9_9FIRM|nr:pyruvate kinase [Peptoniphilus indolicus]EGY80232.1 pyruvate kinase [Peptoniphilus indolicus ATCC 29427]SUB75267.1 Pyruvate kinase [Peptoniphilus indolicus]
MKKTKIVATIGPATESKEILKQLFTEGVDVCRLNFSHGSHEEHQVKIDRIKEVREEMGLPVAIMLDTKGPEIRLGLFKDSMEVRLESGDNYTLTNRDVEGDETIASISYADLPRDITVGSRILIDDGLVGLRVLSKTDTDIYTEVENGGVISQRKGVNAPGVDLKLPLLNDKDKSDIIFGVKNDIDFIAASFVRSKEDVLEIRKVLEDAGNYDIKIISKIESEQGLANLDEILAVSDGIMVARGDLGVEIPTERVPLAQKEMIKKCNIAGKSVITATQMLDSMMRNPRPTRAEANDVANAVLDGTSAVMLSGETASGKYPLNAVKVMREIVEVTEDSINYQELLEKQISEISTSVTNAIGKSTCTIAQDLSAKAIITATTSGSTTRAISKFRPKSTIIAATTSERVRRQLALTWGAVSILVPALNTTDEVFKNSINRVIEEKLVEEGDVVVITAGVPVGLSGSTNLIKVQTIAKVLTQGTGIGKELVTGRAVVVNSVNDLINNFKEGNILVVSNTDKEIISFVERAGGIIAEAAGYTSHAAITAISLGIPTIVGADGALTRINTGDIVTIDPSEGTVRKGIY